MKRVLIITIASNLVDRSETLRRFSDGLNIDSELFDYAMIQDIVFRIQSGELSVTYRGEEIAEHFSTIHLRNHDKYADYANALRIYCDAHDIHVINRADACLPYFGKLSQGVLLALNNVPTPDLTTAFGNQALLQQLDGMTWQYPIVIKHNEGIRGVDNYLVKDVDELKTALAQPKQGFVAQPFIPNSGELRVLTFGTVLDPLVFQKTAVKGTYLNNTSQGGEAELVAVADVPADILADAMKAASLMGREIAGVDVLLVLDGSHTILEVNSTPAIASGVYLTEKQDIYRHYFAAESWA